MASDEKLKALDAAISNIEKQFGKGSIMKLGESNVNLNVESIPTGSLSLDIALGLGGVPRGRVVEIYGPESSGKTTVALHMVAEVQKRGGIAGFIDAEHALDPVYAKNIGVDIDNLYISQPDSGEQALEITETMVRSGAVDIIIVDSVAALVPKAEIDGDMGDSHVGLQARIRHAERCAQLCHRREVHALEAELDRDRLEGKWLRIIPPQLGECKQKHERILAARDADGDGVARRDHVIILYAPAHQTGESIQVVHSSPPKTKIENAKSRVKRRKTEILKAKRHLNENSVDRLRRLWYKSRARM